MYLIEIVFINVIDNILKVIDEKVVLLLVLFDMLKVFDSFNYNLLLRKLWKLGFKIFVVFWFSSYLFSRY